MKFKALSFAILASFATNAVANNLTSLEPIIVNADFRPAEIQTTAISITSIGTEEIQ